MAPLLVGDRSSIDWTDATWNPVTGCDRVSPGCDHCYALSMAKRLKAMGNPRYQQDGDPRTSGPGFGLTIHPDLVELPLRWQRPRRIFVNSMSDLFHARVPFGFVERVWATMGRCPQHIFQILTKRPDRMMRFSHRLPELPNVWLGTSIEDQERAGRIDWLRSTRAAVRFISAEPLIGPLEFDSLVGVEWLIAGGESGPGARPCEVDWLRSLRSQCSTDGTAFFLKQLGGHPAKRSHAEALLDGRLHREMPLSPDGHNLWTP